MIELPLVFFAGFLGSSHCVGMCGPFALVLGASSASWQASLTRQLTYSAGRVFTYSVLGAVAGYCGWQLAGSWAGLINVPATLSVAAGCFLVYQGLASAGAIRLKWRRPGKGPCLAGNLLKDFLRSPSRADVFAAGMLTGFLPCGLVYGFLGMAASSRQVGTGILTMAAFGLGTIPIMVVTGSGGNLLSLTARRHLLRIASWCIVVAGMVSIVRGIAFIGIEESGPLAIDSCPLCP